MTNRRMMKVLGLIWFGNVTCVSDDGSCRAFVVDVDGRRAEARDRSRMSRRQRARAHSRDRILRKQVDELVRSGLAKWVDLEPNDARITLAGQAFLSGLPAHMVDRVRAEEMQQKLMKEVMES